MLENLLSTEVVQVVKQVEDWREAVAISCQPLIENGSIEPRYVGVIYHSHDTIGPYYVVDPGTTMPYAHPEEEANKPSLVLTLIPSDVDLDADGSNPVGLLIMLAAVGNTNHTETIFQLTKLSSNKKDIQVILMAKVTQDTLSVIARY